LTSSSLTSSHGLTELKSDIRKGLSTLDTLAQRAQTSKGDIMNIKTSMPKELGYFWESGRPSDHIWVDDGLRKPFLVPSFLCSSYQVITAYIKFHPAMTH
jgi:hypothetical protein